MTGANSRPPEGPPEDSPEDPPRASADGPPETVPGPGNGLTDVAGLRVGHAQRVGDGWRTGVTVVLPPPEGAVCGVDVRGAAPGTRETDLLDPRNLVQRVHAIVLAGGSAYGLAAATGVMEALAEDGVGFPVKPEAVVPIVPAAVIFDLGRGGLPRATPGPALGAHAYREASAAPVPQGSVGAGTGAKAGDLAGGVGTASTVVRGPTRLTVAALAVVNSAGAPVDLASGELYATRYGLPGEFPDLGPADPAALTAWRARVPAHRRIGFNTVIGVLATDAALSKAQCARLAGVGHDGLARAVRPSHLMTDGDAIFGLATGAGPGCELPEFNLVLEAAADAFTRAVGHALLAATGWPDVPSYREAVLGGIDR